MPNTVVTTARFARNYKRFARKYQGLDQDFEALLNQLETQPETGESLGANLYKVRMASASKGRGKSGGFRVITFLRRPHEDGVEIILLTIYDKSEESSIKKEVLLKWAKELA
jgi:mRNA-degrading endonuclease RelE of RelBE toxin-antitoxin system